MPFQTALHKLLVTWRTTYPEKNFPGFDNHVKEFPHSLIILESPGPQVEHTGVVSMFNPDHTAKEIQRLVSIAYDGKRQSGVLCWNAIPWFLDRSPRASDISESMPLHDELLTLLRPKLECVILLGASARRLLPYFSSRVGSARIYGGHHPGRQAQIQQGLVAENEAVFSHIRECFKRDNGALSSMT